MKELATTAIKHLVFCHLICLDLVVGDCFAGGYENDRAQDDLDNHIAQNPFDVMPVRKFSDTGAIKCHEKGNTRTCDNQIHDCISVTRGVVGAKFLPGFQLSEGLFESLALGFALKRPVNGRSSPVTNFRLA